MTSCKMFHPVFLLLLVAVDLSAVSGDSAPDQKLEVISGAAVTLEKGSYISLCCPNGKYYLQCENSIHICKQPEDFHLCYKEENEWIDLNDDYCPLEKLTDGKIQLLISNEERRTYYCHTSNINFWPPY